MTTPNTQAQANGALNVVVLLVAVAVAMAGLMVFTFMTEQSMGVRIVALLAGLALGLVIAAFSSTGKRFIAYGRESWEELRRVVWPTKKETLNTTGIVIAFVVVVSLYLFIVDKLIEWGLYDGLLKLAF